MPYREKSVPTDLFLTFSVSLRRMPELKPRVSKVGPEADRRVYGREVPVRGGVAVCVAMIEKGCKHNAHSPVEVSVFLIVFLRRARGLSCMFTQFHANCTQPENAKQHSTGDRDYL